MLRRRCELPPPLLGPGELLWGIHIKEAEPLRIVRPELVRAASLELLWQDWCNKSAQISALGIDPDAVGRDRKRVV